MTRIMLTLMLAMLVLAGSAGAQTTPSITDAAKDAKTFFDVLKQYEGLATNLGKLVRATDAFLLFEQEGVEMVVATAAVASFQFILEVDEDEGTRKEFLEIQLYSRE